MCVIDNSYTRGINCDLARDPWGVAHLVLRLDLVLEGDERVLRQQRVVSLLSNNNSKRQ